MLNKSEYRIARNFRVVQNFAFFGDGPGPAKIARHKWRFIATILLACRGLSSRTAIEESKLLYHKKLTQGRQERRDKATSEERILRQVHASTAGKGSVVRIYARDHSCKAS